MAKVIGYSSYDFVDGTGKRIQGSTIYYTEPFANSNGQGVKPDKCSISTEQLENSGLKVGDEVVFLFKKNSNRVESIHFI